MNNETETIHLIYPAGEQTVDALPGDTVLDVIRRGAAVALPAPCAGHGRCGRCRVSLEPGADSPPLHDDELRTLNESDRNAGVRLACRLPVRPGMRVHLAESKGTRIETRAEGFDDELDPVLKRNSVVLPVGSLEDQRSAATRLEEALGLETGSLPSSLSRDLPSIPDGTSPVSVLMEEGRPVAVDMNLPGDSPVWAAAVDIGTTTVAMYLVNLADGNVAGSEAELNAQAPFGADVVSRLEHARKGADEARGLQDSIVTQLREMLGVLVTRHGVDPGDVHLLAVAGNTAMIHLMAGWDASGLGEAPFLPTALEAPAFEGRDIGFSGFPRLRVWPVPSLSAYVGADITAGLVSSGMANRDGTELLLDIGTNGEMAIGGASGLVCCSTAAGPAFEGAHLSSGSGSIPGAVDHVDWIDGRFSWTTIDDVPALGFCGSGVVDLVAFLVNSGLMDETGRIAENFAEAGHEEAYPGLTLESGEFGAELHWEAPSGGTLTFTQKDLREVQLAKAAIRAGIETLLEHSDLKVDDISTLWLAGGFGSYIRPESAADIGLIPRELVGRTRSLGNAAARGALLSLLSRTRKNETRQIAREAVAIELSGRPEFQNAYIEAMMFPAPGDD